MGEYIAQDPTPSSLKTAALILRGTGSKLGEGTYAVVFLGHLAGRPADRVAIKKIKVNPDFNEGLSMDAIREIKYLQELRHPNVIALHDVFSSKDQNVNLVLEYLPLGDLEMMIKDTSVSYTAGDIKAWMAMLARGVWFCHENFVLHRDIKPNNLLIAQDGEIKLADFGLARGFADPGWNMTHQVITRWYRPLELFYGARHYSSAVDIWSMGMVFAELILRGPFCPGSSDLDQVTKITQMLGTPDERSWPGVTQLRDYLPPERPERVFVAGRSFFARTFPTAGPDGYHLIQYMLQLDPRKRLSAPQILKHPYFKAAPPPTRNQKLPRKKGGSGKMGDDLGRRAGALDDDIFPKTARKLDFGFKA